MKVVVLIVISIVIWRWIYANPLPCLDNFCAPRGDPTDCRRKFFIDDVIKHKRDSNFQNITNPVRNAAMAVGENLHIVRKRNGSSDSVENPPSSLLQTDKSKRSLTKNQKNVTDNSNITSKINNGTQRDQIKSKIKRQISDIINSTEKNYNENSTLFKDKPETPDNKHGTSKAQDKTKVKRQLSDKENGTFEGKNKSEAKRQTPDSKNHTHVDQSKLRVKRQNSDIGNSTLTIQNTSKPSRQTANLKNDTLETQNKIKVKRENSNIENDAVGAHNKTTSKRRISDTKNSTFLEQDKNRPKRQATDLKNETLGIPNIITVKRETVGVRNSTLGTQNKTAAKRQISDIGNSTFVRQNESMPKRQATDVKNGTFETQSKSTAKRDNSDIKNNTVETHAKTTVRRQTLDVKNGKFETQTETTVKRQIFDAKNNTILTQNKEILKRQTINIKNNSLGTKNTTPVKRNTSGIKNETLKAQNKTIIKRQISDVQNNTYQTQAKTTVKRETSDITNVTNGAQNKTAIKRQRFNAQNKTLVVTKNRLKRQTTYVKNDTLETHNITKVKRECCDHKNETLDTEINTSVERQISDLKNDTAESQNKSTIKRETYNMNNNTLEAQIKSTLKRHSFDINYDIQNQNRHKRQTNNLKNNTLGHHNKAFFKREASRIKNDTVDVHNKTRIKKKPTQNEARPKRSALKNNTLETQNKTVVKRKTSDAPGTRNTTKIKRQASDTKNSTLVTKNKSRTKRQTTNFKNDGLRAQDGAKVKRETFEIKNNTTGAQNKTTVKRQTSDIINITKDSSNRSTVKRDTVSTKIITASANGSATHLVTVKRQVSDIKNHTHQAQNTTRYKRQSTDIRNSTHEVHSIKNNETHSSEFTNNNKTLDSKETQVITRIKRQINIPKFETQETDDTVIIIKPISVDKNDSTNQKKKTKVKRQTYTVVEATREDPESEYTEPILFISVMKLNCKQQPSDAQDVTAESYNAAEDEIDNKIKRQTSNEQKNVRIKRDVKHQEKLTTEMHLNKTVNKLNHHRKRNASENEKIENLSTNSSRAIREVDNTQHNITTDLENQTDIKRSTETRNVDKESTFLMKIVRRSSEATENELKSKNNATTSEDQKSRASKPRSASTNFYKNLTSAEENLLLGKYNQTVVKQLGDIYLHYTKNETKPHIHMVHPTRHLLAIDESNLEQYFVAPREENELQEKNSIQNSISVEEKQENMTSAFSSPNLNLIDGEKSAQKRHTIAGNEINNEYLKYEEDDMFEYGEEIGFNDIEVVTKKLSRNVERVICLCAMYRHDLTNKDEKPSILEYVLDFPIGKDETEKKLLCTMACGEMATNDVKLKEDVTCSHVKTNEGGHKEIAFPDYFNLDEDSQMIFCRVYTSRESDSSLQCIVSWLNFILLDIVVCLTGLGLICMYLVCFVTWKRQKSTPVYAAAAFTIK